MAAIMLQGTGSDVGKSVLVAGLCRLFTNRGLRVMPFKPQNMSNNAAVTADGGEIGRAQALQALACRMPASVDMNPVLLKPQSDVGAQVIVHGKVRGTQRASDYQARKGELLTEVLASYARLQAGADLVIVEGAGSPAEINLRRGDIANMGFARAAGVPVVLVGDIDRGGVIAAIVGTQAVIEPEDAVMIRGFLINKFRGDVRLFDDGYREIERRTGWAGLGVVPWLPMARRLPAEDAVVLDHGNIGGGAVTVAVPMLSRIANFDDFDPLAAEPGVRLVMVPPGSPLPAEAKLVILPGTKATIADLAFFRAQGWDIDLAGHVRRGGRVLGICGGYQMLGESIADPDGIEGRPETVAGLGLLPVETVVTGDKRVTEVAGVSLADGLPFAGYEIHSGRTYLKPSPFGRGLGEGFRTPRPDARPSASLPLTQPSPRREEGFKALLRLDGGTEDGLTDGQIAGCYIHGLFNRPEQRAAWLAMISAASDGIDQAHRVDAALDELAEALEQYVDAEQLMKIARTAA